MRSSKTRDAEVIAAVRSLGTYANAPDAGGFRAYSRRCIATYVNLPDGGFVEIHDDLDGTYAAFIVTRGGQHYPLSEDAAVQIIEILVAANFPIDP